MFTGRPYIKKFRSFAEAEALDDEEYMAMTPQERLALVFELVENYRHFFREHETDLDAGLPRLRRVVEPQ